MAGAWAVAGACVTAGAGAVAGACVIARAGAIAGACVIARACVDCNQIVKGLGTHTKGVGARSYSSGGISSKVTTCLPVLSAAVW